MKKFIKGRWFPLTVLVIMVTAVALALGINGWRITYVPELESSWDAISAVAMWASVAVSIIAVIASFTAVWYTIKVADKQNKIDLFNKRYNVYKTVQNCHNFFHILQETGDIDNAHLYLLSLFDREHTLNLIQALSKSEENTDIQNLQLITAVKCKEIVDTLKESKFLFTIDVKSIEYIEKIAYALNWFFSSNPETEEYDPARIHLWDVAESYTQMDELLKKIEQFLKV